MRRVSCCVGRVCAPATITGWRQARDAGALAGSAAPRGRKRRDRQAEPIDRLQAEKQRSEERKPRDGASFRLTGSVLPALRAQISVTERDVAGVPWAK